MTQEEKSLLLQDLCARLPYGVKVKCASETLTLNVNWLKVFQYHLDEIKPYLRPMSSMTSKEWLEFCDCSLKDEMSLVMTKDRKFVPVQNREDYLNSKHFDYRGLIPMGLALPAPEGMYK